MSILSHIENSNPFFIPFIIVTTITLIHFMHRIKNVPGRLRRFCHLLPFTPRTTHMTLCIITLSTFFASLMFEYYFRVGQCMVSERYMDENERLFRQVTSILSTAGIVWWVDMATLLSVLRNQRIVAWDHDTDISLIHPSSHTTWTSLQSQMSGTDIISPAFTLNEIIALLKNKGINAYYISERDLLQVRWSTDRFGPHTDIWFWHISGDTLRTAILTTPETSIYHNKRPYTSIFPLQTSPFLNGSVMIPKDSHDVSTHEYSHYGGDYMTAQWFRKDCLHNWWQARYRY